MHRKSHLVLLTLTFLLAALPAVAGDLVEPADDGPAAAFESGVAGACHLPAGSDGVEARVDQAPKQKTCSASTECIDGSTVSCTGTNRDCSTVPECYVTCDGTTHFCPVFNARLCF